VMQRCNKGRKYCTSTHRRLSSLKRQALVSVTWRHKYLNDSTEGFGSAVQTEVLRTLAGTITRGMMVSIDYDALQKI